MISSPVKASVAPFPREWASSEGNLRASGFSTALVKVSPCVVEGQSFFFRCISSLVRSDPRYLYLPPPALRAGWIYFRWSGTTCYWFYYHLLILFLSSIFGTCQNRKPRSIKFTNFTWAGKSSPEPRWHFRLKVVQSAHMYKLIA